MLADSIGLPVLFQEVSVGHAKAKGRSMAKDKKAKLPWRELLMLEDVNTHNKNDKENSKKHMLLG